MALSFEAAPKKRHCIEIATKRMDLISRTLAENGFKVESIKVLPSERNIDWL